MTGPRRRTAITGDTGLNYTAIGATTSSEVVAFPPEGFRAAEYRHRVGSGARRFELASRALMTWGALRGAGFAVEEVRAEPPGGLHDVEPLFLEDGTPWITPGMTALVTGEGGDARAPVKVVTVLDGPGRVGYVWGTRPGHPDCVERLLLLEHDADDVVRLTLRSLWRSTGSRWSPSARAADARQRRSDERLVRALHPANAG